MIQKPAEQPADVRAQDPAETPAAEQPAGETTEEPAAEQPADEMTQEPAEKPAAAQPAETAPAEKKAAPAEEPIERAIEEQVTAPPTISEDAPSEPHRGESPSPSQPQPVYPEDEPGAAAEPKGKVEADKPVREKAVEEELIAPPTVSEEAPTDMGEPSSPSQPQPVFPEDAPGAAAEPKGKLEADEPVREKAVEEEVIAPPTASEDIGKPSTPSQPPVYPEGEPGAAVEPDKPAGEKAVEEEVIAPPTVLEAAPSEGHLGEPPSPSQPQPVYPEDEPSAAAGPKDTMEAEQPAGAKATEEEVVAPPTALEDAPSEGHLGEPPSPSQPQPVYPDEKPEGL